MRHLPLSLTARIGTVAALTWLAAGCAGGGTAQTGGGGSPGPGGGGPGGADPTGRGGSGTGGSGAAGKGGGQALMQLKTDLPNASPCTNNSPGPRAFRRLTAA